MAVISARWEHLSDGEAEAQMLHVPIVLAEESFCRCVKIDRRPVLANVRMAAHDVARLGLVRPQLDSHAFCDAHGLIDTPAFFFFPTAFAFGACCAPVALAVALACADAISSCAMADDIGKHASPRSLPVRLNVS